MKHRVDDETLERFLLGALFDEMAAFELNIRTAVRGYHIHFWMPTIGEEFVCCQECVNAQ